jgi:hypothetical protein
MRRSQGDGLGSTPRRATPGTLPFPALPGRRRSRRADATPRTDTERINAIAAGADVPVEDVLRDVADFRLALETDMIIAAAAIDAATPELLAEVLDGERAELATFHDRVLERLADAAASDELALRRDRRKPRLVVRTARYAAVAAAVTAVLGVGGAAVRTAAPETTTASNSRALATAQDQYASFSSAVSGSSPGQLRQTAQELHQTLQTLITQHAGDPEVARRTAQLLQAEISLLEIRDPEGASQVLAQARGLVRLLQHAAPPKVRASVAPILDAVKASAKPTPAPKPKPSPTATPKPTPTASPSPTETNPLP